MPSAEVQAEEVQGAVTQTAEAQTEEIQPAEIHPTVGRPGYLPSLEEIAEVTAEIRAEWSPSTFRNRASGGRGSESAAEESHWTPPEASLRGLSEAQ